MVGGGVVRGAVGSMGGGGVGGGVSRWLGLWVGGGEERGGEGEKEKSIANSMILCMWNHKKWEPGYR